MSLKVKILTEGGNNIGLGHISRCMSLYNEVSCRGISADLIINGDVKNVDFLKGTTFVNNDWLQKGYLHNNIKSDDYVIIDSYKAKKADYADIVKVSRKTMFIDDIGRLDYPNGIIVNPSIDSSQIDYSESSNSSLLTGPDYVIVRSPFLGVIRENTLDGINRILITMGGTDIRGLTELLINNVCKNLVEIEFDIVVGSKKSLDLLKNYTVTNNITVHYNIDANDMKNLMLSCDLAITAAGQTIYELLATQTPFIPIQIIENQENNIKSLKKYYPNQIVLKHDDKYLVEKILNALDQYNISANRLEHKKAYEGLIDGYGAKRVIDKLLEN